MMAENRVSRWVALLAGVYALGGGAVSFSGWMFDIPRLTDWDNRGVHIQPNTCVLLMGLGAGLIAQALGLARVVLALGALVGLAGALTLSQYVVGADFGFNHQLMFGRPWGQSTTASPGRMGPPASSSFTLLGAALVVLGATGPRAGVRRIVPVLGIAVCGLMSFSLLGYLFGAEQFYTIPWLTAIAFQTASMLLAAALGAIASVPEHQPTVLLRERSGAGAMARVLLPLLIVLPPTIIWLRAQGLEYGYYDAGTSQALGALAQMVLLIAVAGWALLALRRREAAERTSRDAERARSALFQTVLATSPSPIWIAMDSRCERIVGNPAAEALFSAPRGSNLSQRAASRETYGYRCLRNGVEIPEEALPMQRAARERVTVAGEELEVIRGDGSRLWLMMYAAPLPYQDGAVGVGVDISEPKRAAAAALESAGVAERASRVKDEFLATLSHELRTPMMAILGWAQMIREKALPLGGQVPEEMVRGAEVIERNARLQAQIIDDLLDMGRILSGTVRLRIAMVHLDEVVAGAAEAVRLAAEAKGLRLEVACDPDQPPIRGDPGRLQQVVYNLLANAVKFTPNDGTIRVECRRAEDAGGAGGVRLRVRDTGIGIDPAFLPHVFERFRQQDSSTGRRFGGLGLGLAIVKHVVELHGGTVEAASEGRGRGAEFTVCLPVAPPEAPAASSIEPKPARAPAPGAPPSTSAAPLRGVKVFVVDDEPDTREIVSATLARCGADVTVAASGPEALARLRDLGHRPDVLVCDVGLPEMDGYALMERVRGLPVDRGGATPAIALTAFAGENDRAASLRAGFQVHLAKPVDADVLTATIVHLAGDGRRHGGDGGRP